jgi:hypothetical protein
VSVSVSVGECCAVARRSPLRGGTRRPPSDAVHSAARKPVRTDTTPRDL